MAGFHLVAQAPRATLTIGFITAKRNRENLVVVGDGPSTKHGRFRTFPRQSCPLFVLMTRPALPGQTLILLEELVLPDRIELSTSPLPMECSTTELRQHARYSRESAQKAPTGGRFLPQGPLWRKHAATEGTAQNGQKSARVAGCGPIRFPVSPAGARNAVMSASHASNSIILV